MRDSTSDTDNEEGERRAATALLLPFEGASAIAGRNGLGRNATVNGSSSSTSNALSRGRGGSLVNAIDLTKEPAKKACTMADLYAFQDKMMELWYVERRFHVVVERLVRGRAWHNTDR